MINSSVAAYGGISSLPDDVGVELVPVDTSFSITEFISMAAPIIVAFTLIVLIALAGRYIIDKYVMGSNKSKIKKFVLGEIIYFIEILLMLSVLCLLAKIENPDTSFKEEFLSINWWLYIVVFLTIPIIILLFSKFTANWKEWKIFKKWND
jgi:hypothetical protein